MSQTPVVLTATMTSTGGSVVTTTGITPSADQLILGWVVSNPGGDPPTLTGNGLTWHLLEKSTTNAGISAGSMYYTLGSAPSSGSVTIDFNTSSQNSVSYSFIQIAGAATSGVDGAGAIVQSTKAATGNAFSVTATFPSPTSTGNAVYGGAGGFIQSTNPFNAGTSFTILSSNVNTTGADRAVMMAQWYGANSSQVGWSITSTGLALRWSAMIAEVLSASTGAAAQFITPKLFLLYGVGV